MRLFTPLFFCLIVLVPLPPAQAQVICPQVNMEFSTQADVDNFPSLGCTVIEGDVRMFSDDILNLDSLYALQEIGGTLFISSCDSLVDLHGLEGLQYIGGDLRIGAALALTLGNAKLESLEGLNQLDSIGGSLFLDFNQSLINFQGLDNLKYIGKDLIMGAIYLTSPNGGLPQLKNLIGLEALNYIGGNLQVWYNDALEDFSGLENLSFLGGDINIYQNPSLETFQGLSGIDFVGQSFYISENDALTQLADFELLDTVFGDLIIEKNPQLSSLGLAQVEKVFGQLFIGNTQLTDLSDLTALKAVQGDFSIAENNNLTNLEGMTNLEEVHKLIISKNGALTDLQGLEVLQMINGDLTIYQNEQLTSLKGLGNLQEINGRFTVSQNDQLTGLLDLEELQFINGSLRIQWNDLIGNLEGLDNLEAINGWLYIEKNIALTDISALNNLDPSSISYLQVARNYSLSICDIPLICSYLASEGVHAIGNNAPGCLAVWEVEYACGLSDTESVRESSPLHIYPNPASDLVWVEMDKSGEWTASLRDMQGQLVIPTFPVEGNAIDLSQLPSGVYILEVNNSQRAFLEKIMKQ